MSLSNPCLQSDFRLLTCMMNVLGAPNTAMRAVMKHRRDECRYASIDLVCDRLTRKLRKVKDKAIAKGKWQGRSGPKGSSSIKQDSVSLQNHRPHPCLTVSCLSLQTSYTTNPCTLGWKTHEASLSIDRCESIQAGLA